MVAKITRHLRCAELNCREVGFREYATKTECQDEHERDEKWKCVRHTNSGCVLSRQSLIRSTAYEVIELGCGKFWQEDAKNAPDSGFLHGPGFCAWADDFPVGTRLTVLAKLTVS